MYFFLFSSNASRGESILSEKIGTQPYICWLYTLKVGRNKKNLPNDTPVTYKISQTISLTTGAQCPQQVRALQVKDEAPCMYAPAKVESVIGYYENSIDTVFTTDHGQPISCFFIGSWVHPVLIHI